MARDRAAQFATGQAVEPASELGISGQPKAPFDNLRRKKAYEEVADQIRERIFSQHLRLHDRLPTERELAEQFGVSRVAVREAIRMLELNGMLTVKKGPKGGLFVAQDYERPISDSIANLLNGGEASLEDLFEVRALIEPFAAARAATLGTAGDIVELERLIDEAELELSQGRAIRHLNIEFHRYIIKMSRNPILAAVGETVLLLLSDRIRHTSSQETSASALIKHAQILDAIRQREPARARAAMADDIGEVGQRLADATK